MLPYAPPLKVTYVQPEVQQLLGVVETCLRNRADVATRVAFPSDLLHSDVA